ncbi:hypothetical protein CDD83_8369 [Cordyceps sp. RAO-2017]|nr:hypothetical protein CDD83_8369 [Cordyceps sp. RAO-2017]
MHAATRPAPSLPASLVRLRLQKVYRRQPELASRADDDDDDNGRQAAAAAVMTSASDVAVAAAASRDIFIPPAAPARPSATPPPQKQTSPGLRQSFKGGIGIGIGSPAHHLSNTPAVPHQLSASSGCAVSRWPGGLRGGGRPAAIPTAVARRPPQQPPFVGHGLTRRSRILPPLIHIAPTTTTTTTTTTKSSRLFPAFNRHSSSSSSSSSSLSSTPLAKSPFLILQHPPVQQLVRRHPGLSPAPILLRLAPPHKHRSASLSSPPSSLGPSTDRRRPRPPMLLNRRPP